MVLPVDAEETGLSIYTDGCVLWMLRFEVAYLQYHLQFPAQPFRLLPTFSECGEAQPERWGITRHASDLKLLEIT